MIPAPFDYLAPTSVEEALAALSQHGDDAKIIAGGQRLLPVLRMRLNAPEMVIDLGPDPVAAGRARRRRRDRDRGDDPALRRRVRPVGGPARGPDLRGRWSTVADAQVRHRGTFGGALAHADPAGDLGAPALALEASFVDRRAGRHPDRGGGRLLRRPLRDRDRRRRGPHRGPAAQAHRVGRALREVRPGGPPVADRGRGRGGPGRGRRDRRGPDRADQHGLDAAAGTRGRGGAGRAAAVGGRRTHGGRARRPRARTRPPTSTATRTTAGTSPGC